MPHFSHVKEDKKFDLDSAMIRRYFCELKWTLGRFSEQLHVPVMFMLSFVTMLLWNGMYVK